MFVYTQVTPPKSPVILNEVVSSSSVIPSELWKEETNFIPTDEKIDALIKLIDQETEVTLKTSKEYLTAKDALADLY